MTLIRCGRILRCVAGVGGGYRNPSAHPHSIFKMAVKPYSTAQPIFPCSPINGDKCWNSKWNLGAPKLIPNFQCIFFFNYLTDDKNSASTTWVKKIYLFLLCVRKHSPILELLQQSLSQGLRHFSCASPMEQRQRLILYLSVNNELILLKN